MRSFVRRWRPRRRALRRGRRRLARSAPWRSNAPPICWKQNRGSLLALLQNEGGKTLDDALAEVREAVDYCRYYAAQARHCAGAAADAGADRRKQCAALSRPRRFRLHQSVEFSARDLSRPGQRGARRRQCRRRQAGRADAADRRPRGRAAARGRRAGHRAASRSRRRRCRRAASSPIRASPASSSPARPKSAAPSTARSPKRTARSCR